MIGNTDWSMVYQHNVEMLYLNSAAFAIPYDFDHSGIVNAYYAKPNPMLNIRSVRDRIYRGMCRKDPLIFEKMRQYYVSKMCIHLLNILLLDQKFSRTFRFFCESKHFQKRILLFRKNQTNYKLF